MEYINRFFSSAKRMYSDINPATLNGAIDVIVVQYPDGELVSSTFYVQFGKTGVFRPSEDEVEVKINGTVCENLQMRVNHLGHSYFIHQDIKEQTSCPSPTSGLSPADSGIMSDEKYNQFPSDRCESPSIPTVLFSIFSSTSADLDPTNDIDAGAEETELLKCFPILLQSVSYGEFESNIQWWNQQKDKSPIQTYCLPDEQSQALQSGAGIAQPYDNCWVFWEEKWFYWKTAAIRLRILRSLEKPFPQSLELKLMELDRQNPAFTFLPSRPPSSSESSSSNRERNDEISDDRDMNAYYSAKMYPPSLFHSDSRIRTQSITISSLRIEETPDKMIESTSSVEYAVSEPNQNSPNLSSDKDRAYFSDSYEPKEGYKEIAVNNERMRRRMTEHWARSYDSPAFNLSSDEIKQLGLNEGINEASFTVVNKYQGTCSCNCLIYLWKSTDKIVLTDVDGTITKSDIWGHLLPMIGWDWIHAGVVELYRKIVDNGYHVMYLSARAIGQANTTRRFLEDLEQGMFTLPPGPIILSPNSVITTIQMEMIKRRPQELKIAILKRLETLFRKNDASAPSPFIAGFGNRVTDVATYQSIGIPDSHIFIVNPKGEMIIPTGVHLPTGYREFKEIVNVVFPPLNKQTNSESREFSDFLVWRDNVPNDFDPKNQKSKFA